jgi:hypothetical protein
MAEPHTWALDVLICAFAFLLVAGTVSVIVCFHRKPPGPR